MNYLQPRKKRRIFFLAPPVILIAIAVSIFVFRPTMPGFLTQSLHTLGIPLWRAKSELLANARDIFSFLSSKRSLIEENVLLNDELNRLRLRLFAVSALQDEMGQLISVFRHSAEQNAVLAVVLVKPNITPYDMLIVDAGEDKGVTVSDWVLVEESLIIGRVTEVYRKSALVTLFSSPDEENSIIIGPSHIQATAIGEGGGNFETTLPRGVPIEEGDAVLMPGINPLLFGVVEKVIAEPSDSFQTILFKNPVNISELYYVELVSHE